MVTARAVEEAWRAGEVSVALDRALSAWRATRHPLLSDIVRCLDEQNRAATQSPVPADRVFHSAWIAAAKAPDAEDRATVTGWLAVTLGAQRSDLLAFGERVDALLARGPDPRIAHAICGIPEGAAGVRLASNLLKSHLHAFHRAAEMDPSAARRMLDEGDEPTKIHLVCRSFWSWLTDARRSIEQFATDYKVPEDIEEYRALLALFRPAEAAKDELAELFNTVVANIDDDGPRYVFADFLMSFDDGRGEMMARSLADPGDEEATAFMVKHRREWLGKYLGTTLVYVEFERGVPTRATLTMKDRVQDEVWTQALNDARLGTLRELRCGLGQPSDFLQFLRAPALSNLNAVEIPSTPVLDYLVRPTEQRRFHHVHLHAPRPLRPHLRRMAVAPAFEALETLWVPPTTRPEDLAAALRSTGWADRLQTVGVHGGEGSRLPSAYRTAVDRLGLHFVLREKMGLGDYATSSDSYDS